MKHRQIAIGSAGLLFVAVVATGAPKLSSEWTYDKEMRHYSKSVPAKVTRPTLTGSGQNYFFDLQRDKLRAYDDDNDSSTGVTLNDKFTLEVQKKRKDRSERVSVVINKCGYVDLDGDGIWDVWGDARGDSRKSYIRFGGVWVEVCDSKSVGDGPELSLDRKSEYTWDGKEWKSKSVER